MVRGPAERTAVDPFAQRRGGVAALDGELVDESVRQRVQQARSARLAIPAWGRARGPSATPDARARIASNSGVPNALASQAWTAFSFRRRKMPSPRFSTTGTDFGARFVSIGATSSRSSEFAGADPGEPAQRAATTQRRWASVTPASVEAKPAGGAIGSASKCATSCRLSRWSAPSTPARALRCRSEDSASRRASIAAQISSTSSPANAASSTRSEPTP